MTSSKSKFIILPHKGCTHTIQYVNLQIENSLFLRSSSTAILMYSSIVALDGDIEFMNITGTNGGALPLILRCKLRLSITWPINMVVPFILSIVVYHHDCFYQPLDFDCPPVTSQSRSGRKSLNISGNLNIQCTAHHSGKLE